MSTKLATITVAFCSLLVVGACATERALPVGNDTYSAETGHAYKLGPGDKVRVNVFGEEALSGEFLIASNGAVALPLIGTVAAGGLTPEAFQQTIQAQLIATDMVRAPRVSADVIEYRPYYILGEVNNPGQYTYSIGLTVTKAVATAGGFTYRANTANVFVTREGTATEFPVRITAATRIGPGDTVRIGERMF